MILSVLTATLLAANGMAYAESDKITKLQKICDGGGMESCFNLGVFYDNGEGVRQNYTKAKELFGRVCDAGHQDGCDRYKKLNEKGY